MASLLIKHLKQCVEKDPALSILENQWGFDEKLIPKALQTIGNLFTHYSRHDESHSRQILTNIERLLGPDRIELLTATDTWLLLESAYWHDIGMVVSSHDYQDALKDTNFEPFLQEFINKPHHELHHFCTALKNDNNWLSCADSPLQALEQFKHLFSEWFRRQHAERAQKIVRNPWELSGISSPRTELMPNRLFKLLGKICLMHGCNFDEIIDDDKLPFKAVGIATEDCHPRYVACLLRLGDLLDLDDNRFCPVMKMQAGDNRPEISKHHEDKHSSIEHFRLDPERIEITSVCKNIDSYLETHNWFNWLKTEIQNQMASWQQLAPNKILGLLPTLGKLEVKLNNGQLVLFDGKRPQFELDKQQAIHILQGLYTDPFVCIRELLQNAVDSTLLRFHIEQNDNKDLLKHWDTPCSSPVLEQLDKEQIIVHLKPAKTTSEEYDYWDLIIEDFGTGISQNDLKYMLKIGGSQNNQQRRYYIDKMPEWLKPSGAFGIGFQSIFQLSEKVTLTTRSIFSGDTLRVTLHNPIGPNDGLALIEKLTSTPTKKSGTKLEVELKISKHLNYSLNTSDEHTFHDYAANSYDPNLDTSYLGTMGYLGDKVSKFNKYSFIPVSGFWSPTASENFKINKNSNCDEDIDEWNIIKYENEIFKVKFNTQDLKSYPMTDVYYRGQSIKSDGFQSALFSITIDIMSSNAHHWLTAERKELSSKGKERLNECIHHELPKMLYSNLDNYNKANISFIAEINKNITNSNSWGWLATKLKDKWVDLTINENETISPYIKDNNHITYQKSRVYAGKGLITPTAISVEGELNLIDDSAYSKGLILLITEYWIEKNKNLLIDYEKNNYLYRYKLLDSGGGHIELSDNALAQFFISSSSHGLNNFRPTLPITQHFQEFAKLKVKPSVKLRSRPIINISIPKSQGFIILPYLFISNRFGSRNEAKLSLERKEEFYNWLIDNDLFECEIALSEVKSLYGKLIDKIDEIILATDFKNDWEKITSEIIR